MDLSLERIAEASRTVDPVFLRTPQYGDALLDAALGRQVVVKVETANPLRSFKGRGADFMLGSLAAGPTVVCSSTGNFGQAIAYAGRRRDRAVEVFVPETINPVKLARMRAFGARVTLAGRDTVTADDAAREHAAAAGDRVIVEDGRQAEIAEGAGTIGVELLDAGPFDAIVVPVGDGALIAGIALWVKAHAPSTRIVGVCATGAPSLAESWRARRPVSTSSSNTIAEGLDICVPVPESVARVVELVDDMVLVDDADLLRAMRLSLDTIGVVLEPSGAAGLAAIQKQLVAGERVATVLTGSNVRPEHFPPPGPPPRL